jgi:DNA gyrase subunit B
MRSCTTPFEAAAAGRLVGSPEIWERIRKLLASLVLRSKASEQENRRTFLAQFGPKMTGTRIHFVPDATIFETTTFDYDVLAHRMRELAFLNAGLTIVITDGRTGDTATYCYAGGLVEFVKYLNEGAECLHPAPIDIAKKDPENKLELEIALQYTAAYDEKIYSYVNSVNTREGGTHLEGFRSAITRTINTVAKRNGLIKENATITLRGEDVREGLTSVVSIKMANPQFDGQTKMRLGNSSVKGVVDSLVYAALTEYFDENPNVLKTIIEKALSRKPEALIRQQPAALPRVPTVACAARPVFRSTPAPATSRSPKKSVKPASMSTLVTST